MPGYPNYFLIGDRRWQATTPAADRVSAPTRILNTTRWASVHADAGQQVGGCSIPVPGAARLRAAAVAIRLGIRSAYGGGIYVTYARPLVKMAGANERQFVIGNIINF